jgi:hypothetical protein
MELDFHAPYIISCCDERGYGNITNDSPKIMTTTDAINSINITAYSSTANT